MSISKIVVSTAITKQYVYLHFVACFLAQPRSRLDDTTFIEPNKYLPFKLNIKILILLVVVGVFNVFKMKAYFMWPNIGLKCYVKNDVAERFITFCQIHSVQPQHYYDLIWPQ